jgi:hypothetical protein
MMKQILHKMQDENGHDVASDVEETDGQEKLSDF